ncbi:MAG: DUF4937 domain-containing protein [Candidatus Sericytochromatia bacterium]|nr:DUF4937 domain-containing protein [Candidatus Sericytochromatia bacterium]
MFVKLFVTTSSDPARFTQGQLAWRQLAGLPGFLGQLGGWGIANPREAVILSLWQDEAAYDRFMAADHDRIYAVAGQTAVRDTSQMTCFLQDRAIAGRQADLGDLVPWLARDERPVAPFMRLVECVVHPGAREAFRHMQATLWNPALTANGVLAGVFGVGTEDPHRFLTATVWASAADHDAYNRNVIPALMRQTDVIGACRAITGRVVHADPDWTVCPA